MNDKCCEDCGIVKCDYCDKPAVESFRSVDRVLGYIVKSDWINLCDEHGGNSCDCSPKKA